MVSVAMEQGTPTVRIELEGMQRNLIVDTGSNVSILQPSMSRHDVLGTRPYGVTGEVLDIKGLQCHLHVERTRIHSRVPSMHSSCRRSRSAWHRIL